MSTDTNAPTQAEAAPGAPATTTTAAPTTSTAAPAAPAPAAAAEAPGEPLDFQATQDAITEATLTGQHDTATRLRADLKAAQQQQQQTPPPAEAAAAPAATEEEPPAGDENEEEEEDDKAPTTENGTEEPPAGDTPPAESDKPLGDRVRINHLSPEDKAAQHAINALTKGGMTLLEATNRVLGGPATSTPTPAPEATDPATPPPAATDTPPDIAEMEERVNDLKSRLKAAGASEGLFNEEIADLTAELSEANATLAANRVAVKQNEANASREAAVFQQQRATSTAAARKVYPAMADKESAQFLTARDMALAAQNPSHPDHEKSWSPDAPEYFAAQAAKRLGIAPKGGTTPKAKAPAVPPVTVPPAQTPPPTTRPASGAKGSAPPPPQKTSAQIRAETEADTEAMLTGQAPVRVKGTVRNGVLMR